MTTDLRAEIRKILDDYSHAKYLESEENGDVVHREDYINPFLDLFEQYAGEERLKEVNLMEKGVGLWLAPNTPEGLADLKGYIDRRRKELNPLTSNPRTKEE